MADEYIGATPETWYTAPGNAPQGTGKTRSSLKLNTSNRQGNGRGWPKNR